MEFTGENRFGFYKPLNLHLKLMSCPVLAHAFMLKIEKTAVTDDEALGPEQELMAFTRQYRPEDRVARDEPTTLLYRTLGR